MLTIQKKVAVAIVIGAMVFSSLMTYAVVRVKLQMAAREARSSRAENIPIDDGKDFSDLRKRN